MRGPGASLYSDEVAAAEEVNDVLDALKEAGIEIKLGQIPDGQRDRLVNLTTSQVQTMKRRKLDILRVLLAREMVAEAKVIQHQCWYSGRRTVRSGANPRRYSDLMFSARAILPPGIDWDTVTYEHPSGGKACWSTQLDYDGHGRQIEDGHAGYNNDEAEQLLIEFKGGERASDEDQALAS